VARRALPFLVEVSGPGPFLLVGHGGLIRVLLGLIDEVPLNEIGRNNIANAEPIARDLKTDQWSTVLASLAG
jgi:broad specificity phosphatase PhoE